MKIRMWGVRGSIPSPGPHTQRYGGNTTCIEVRTDAGALIILDGGTGIFPLAQTLLRQMPLTAYVFITHTHWDHIQGLPFFAPIFVAGNKVIIHGAHDVVTGSGIEKVMTVQLQYSYFPVRESELVADMDYRNVDIGQPVRIADAVVTATLLNHPVVNFGYRIECNGKSVFFTGDHEPYYNIYAPGDEGYDEYQKLIEEKQAEVEAAVRGVDVLIADCSYTREEYPKKVGWGHGTFDSSIALAKKAGVKRLICTHHEPTRSDDDLARVFGEIMARHVQEPGDPEIGLAYEGLELEL
jgi:phosphoribosyl 1,2-cyclic phosphodiesterase